MQFMCVGPAAPPPPSSTFRNKLLVVFWLFSVLQVFLYRRTLKDSMPLYLPRVVQKIRKMKVVDNFSPKIYNKMKSVAQNNGFSRVSLRIQGNIHVHLVCSRRTSVNFRSKTTQQQKQRLQHFSQCLCSSNYNFTLYPEYVLGPYKKCLKFNVV